MQKKNFTKKTTKYFCDKRILYCFVAVACMKILSYTHANEVSSFSI